MKTIRVAEVFESVEGEGPLIGLARSFVRLQGCKAGCKWCDTPYALDPNGGKEVSVDDLLEQINDLSNNCISITGGSPLLQEEAVLDLVSKLKTIPQYHVTIEESGQLFNKGVFDAVDHLSIDIKTPSSGVSADFETLEVILSMYREKTCIKAVISDRADYDFVKNWWKSTETRPGPFSMVLTPAWGVAPETTGATYVDLDKDFVKELVSWVLADKLPMRVIIQQHKIIEVE